MKRNKSTEKNLK